MNISTTPSQRALVVVALLCLLGGQTALAQCPINTIPPAPVNVQVTVDQVTGMATFSSNDVVGIISTSMACDPVEAYKIHFYEDQAKTMPYPWTPPVACIGGGSTVPLTCTDINTTVPVWAAINDGDAPGGAGCGEFDASSESAAVLFNVSVLDKTAPEASAPANITVNAGASCTASAIAGIAMSSVVKVAHPSVLSPGQYTDNCLSHLTVGYYLTGATTAGSMATPISGTDAGVQTFNLGVTTVTYVITDTEYTPGSGTNPVLVSFTVTVADATPPAISCPAPVNLNTAAGLCTATTTLAATATDNCSNTMYWSTNTFSSAPNLAIPDDGCPANVTDMINVSGIGAMSASGKHLAWVDLALTHTYTADLQIVLESPSGTMITLASNVGSSGNNFFVRFNDAAGLNIGSIGFCGCGTASSLLSVAAQGGVLSTFNGANGDGAWKLHVCDGDIADVGTVKYWSLHFEDTALPVTPAYGAGGSASAAFPLGATTVHFLALDNAGNASTCTTTVTVMDMQNPMLTATAAGSGFNATPADASSTNIGTSTAPGNPLCDGSYKWNHPAMSDNCSPLNFPPASLTMELTGMTVLAPVAVTPGDPITQTFNGLGATTVIYKATDNNGKTSIYSFSINVTDDVAPALTPVPAPYSTTVSVTPGDCAKVVTFTRPSAPTIDDCQPVTITEAYESGPDPDILMGAPAFSYGSNVTLQFPVGTTVIRYTWSDGVNTSYVDYSITVNENDPPVAQCQPDFTVVLPLGANGQAQLSANSINNGSSDNCGFINLYVDNPFTSPQDESIYTCAQLGNQTATLYVEDAVGHIATCTSIIKVVDNMSPVLSCPAGQIISTGVNDCLANFNTNLMASDNCGITSYQYTLDAGAPTSFVGPALSLTGLAVGPHTVTITTKDASNNSSSCSFSLTVEDQVAPAFSGCPANITMDANTGGCGKNVSWVPPVFTDNCTAIPVVIPNAYVSSTHTPGTFFYFGTTTVVYTAHDAAGNINNTCSFTVTINDTQPPVAHCKDATVTLGPGGTVNMPAASIDNNSTDNCFYTYQTDPYSFDCSQVGTPQTVTLTIVDAGGLTSSCNATVTVLDGQAPTALCNLIPATLNLSASDCTPPSDPGKVTLNAATVGNATDNCPGNVQYQVSVDGSAFVNSFDFDCSHIGPRQVTLKAYDSAGSTTCGPVTVTIKDVSAPCFTVPPAIVLNCNDSNPNLLDPSNTGQPDNIVDNCDSAPTVTSSDVISTVIGCPNALNITRTWTVSDHATPVNSYSQTQSIQIHDVTGPTWTLGASYSVNTIDAHTCTVPSPIPAVVPGSNVVDACGSLTVTYGITYPSGSGLMDVPGGTPLPIGGVLPNQFPIGVSTVTFIATDECSNPTTLTVTVTVHDAFAPAFSYSRCGQTYTLPNTTNSCDQLYTWTRPVLADIFDCKNYSVTETISNNTVQQFVSLVNPFAWPTTPPINTSVTAQFPVGTTTVTYTATDASNNTSTCSFNVVIQDTQAPTITCPMNQTLPITSGCTGITKVPNYRTLTQVIDNCLNNVVLTQTPDSGTLVSSLVPVLAGNQFTVVLKATDSKPLNLMSASCSFTVTLVDGEAPVPDVLSLPDITSFCTKDTVEAPSATDCNGSQFVTIYGTPSVPVMMTLPPLVPGGPPRYVLNPGNYVITWSYTDSQNNTTTQPQNVSIQVDIFPPTAICKADSVSLDSMGIATINAIQLDNGSYDMDNCGPLTFSFQVGSVAPFTYQPSLSFGCANIGVNHVVFAATDFNGNTATCATTVKVKDVIAPTIANVPANITIQACNAIPAQDVLTATDVCDTLVPVVPTQISTQAPTNEDCGYYNYTITRNWTATDDSGNKTTVTQTITVKDTLAPVFLSPDSIVVLTDPHRATCNDTVFLNMLDFLVDCAPDSELVVTNTLNPALKADITGVYAVGTHVVTFTATDKCGNASTKSIKLVVRDATLPTAVCINGISISLQSGGTVSIGVNQINDSSFDNCAIDSMKVRRLDPLTPLGNTITFNCADADATTHHPVQMFVYDIHGNQSSCQTYVVVQDNVPPTITCPANVTVLCNASTDPTATGTATATDNCPLVPNAISFADTLITGTGPTCKTIQRLWMARDLSGNISTCTQVVALLDTIKPVLSAYPPDITISCSDPVPDPQNVTATDNCDQTLTVQYAQDTINIASGVCGKYDYTIVRTRTVADDCGNTETHVRHIKVEDHTPPKFLGMPDTVTILSANFPPTTDCTVPVTFNAKDYFVECAALSECTIDSIRFSPAIPGLTPDSLNVSGSYPVGTTRVIFAVTDPCGNHGVDTVNIKVVDNTIPTMVCNNNAVIALGSNGSATIDPADIDLGSVDNCGIDSLYLDKSSFTCTDLGTNAIKLTAVDIHGNSNFCQVNVEVTLGTNAGFNLTTTGIAESFFGAGDGAATTNVSGGSGGFTYEWSNMSTLPTIGSLAAGTYTVTVVDTLTGCLAIDTAVVDAGKKITVNIGQITGCQGQTVVVPVTVDNFINVSGFSLGLQLDSIAAGSILNISDINPALTGATATMNSLFWTNSNPLTGVTLPNGSLLFNLNVTLAPPPVMLGTTSPVSASALPALVFLQPIGGTPVQAPMINFNNGSVTINCAAADIEIAGVVKTWKVALPIPGVNVDLSGSFTGTDVTALPTADYSFLVGSGANATLTPSKVATAKSSKINVGDLLFIQAHAAPPPAQVPFTSPYQWLAGDINGDKTVNIVDYVLVQSYIVNNPPSDGHFHIMPAPPDWKFVPKSYVFPGANPLNPTPPSTIQLNAVVQDTLQNDFVGVLLGDVNGDVIPTFAGNAGAEFSQTFKFRVNEHSVQAGEIISIPFRAKDFINEQAYQLTIAFDPQKFELLNIEPGVLPGMTSDNFGTAMLNQGLLSALWAGSKPISLDDNAVLFTLTFKAHTGVNALADVLHVSNEIAEPMAIDGDGNYTGVDIEFATSVGTSNIENKSFVLYQNQPNPFSEETHISFRLPEAGRARLHIFGTDGRLVKTILGDYPAGNNTVTIRKDELGDAGVYWYELETQSHSDRKKMILIH